jgi:hypothetical protein
MQKNYSFINARLLGLLLWATAALLRPSVALAQVVYPQDTMFWCGTQADSSRQRDIIISGSNCSGNNYYQYSPAFHEQNRLPPIPIKTVRLMIHVFQKDDGTANWQSPRQDGGTDEAILQGLINGQTNFPVGNPNPLLGVNDVYSGLYELTTNNPAGQNPTQLTGAGADTRIRFQLEGIRYYRTTKLWDMSTGNPHGCNVNGDNDCFDDYNTVVANSVDNQLQSGERALNNDQRYHILHIFMAENPGAASTQVDNFGNPTSRYGTGGVAGGGAIITRGLYWTAYHHPDGSLAGPLQSSPTAPEVHNGLHYAEFVLCHELGHCLGLPHTFDTRLDCELWPGGPQMPAKGSTNNMMDYPPVYWMPRLSLSDCQIGRMHYFLWHGGYVLQEPGTTTNWGLDELLVQDFCRQDPAQDVTIAPGTTQTWEAAHNLQGNRLTIGDDATLIVRCRVGFAGPRFDIRLGQRSRLILANGTLGNFATSDRNECEQPVEVHISGPGGLVEIEREGGFLSRLLSVVFEDDVTFHVPPASVLFDGAHVEMLPRSYLCLEPGSQTEYKDGATFTVDPATLLGVHPDAQVPRVNCSSSLCDMLAASTRLLNTTGGPICPGEQVVLTIHSPFNADVVWRRSSNIVRADPNTPQTLTDTPTQTTEYEAEVSWPGTNCPPLVLRYLQEVDPLPEPIRLISSALELCPDIAQLTSNGNNYINLNDPKILGLVYDGDDPANQGSTVTWTGRFIIGQRNFNVTEALQRRSPYLLQLCQQQRGQSCRSCAEVVLTLLPSTVFSLSNPTISQGSVCPGTPVQLSATGPERTNYSWQPGGLSGPDVTVAPTVTTTYTVTGTGFERCSSTQQVTVVVKPPTCPECIERLQPVERSLAASFTFYTGQTYLFTDNTTLTNGNFIVQDGSLLLFASGAVLTVGRGAQLQLQGGTLTATCTDAMWGGIEVAPNSRGVVSVSGTGTGPARCEISHSRNGLVLTATPLLFPAQPALLLDNVAFLHNGQSLAVTNSSLSPAFSGRVTNCIFDSDPQQMHAPWQYVSAQDQHVTLRHLSLSGNCAGLTVSDCTLDHALYAFWTPTGAPFTATRNQLRNFYIAALYSHDNLSASLQFTGNTLTYPPANNALQVGDGPQMREAYDALEQLEGPQARLRHFVCVGIYGPTQTGPSTTLLTLAANRFIGQNFRTGRIFNAYEPYPQYGVITGAVAMQRNTFQNLYLGCQSLSTQQGGTVLDNQFTDCYQALVFYNGLAPGSTAGAGFATVNCNTFARTSMRGINYGIVRGFCQRQFNGPCDQIELTRKNGNDLLLKNEFADGRQPNAIADEQRFWHVWNGVDEGYTTNQMQYLTFSDKVDNIVGGPATWARVNGVLTLVSTATNITSNQSTPIGSDNNCLSDGYTHGMQTRSTSTALPTPGTPPAVAARPYYLAQNAPNPCSGSTRIAYRTPADAGQAELVIRHYITGQVLRRQALLLGEHTLELPLTGLLPGPYHYTLEVDQQPLAHHSLLVQ